MSATFVPPDQQPVPLEPPAPLPGLHMEFDDAPSQCTFVDTAGVRCTDKPVMGSAVSSSCEAHRGPHVTAMPLPALTPDESIDTAPIVTASDLA